jgi:hypothetical protein
LDGALIGIEFRRRKGIDILALYDWLGLRGTRHPLMHNDGSGQ